MDYSYWVEGVFLIGTAFLGILWNLIAIYILVTREPMRKLMFNQLLISLLFFDNMFSSCTNPGYWRETVTTLFKRV